MAAITLKQSNPGFIDTSGVGQDAIDKELDALRVRYNEIPLQGGKWFRTEEASNGTFKVATYGTMLELPSESPDASDVPVDTPWKGFNKSFTVVTYRLGTKIERAMTEDQLFPVATKMAGGLMQAYRTLLEYDFANIFNRAQNSSYTGADGVELSSASHPQPERQVGTWSNRETAAALTHGTYSTARVNMRQRPNEKGDPMPLRPKELIVPPALEQKAKEIMQSEKVDDTALNTKNVWMGEVEIMVYDWLTSSTQWMLWGNLYDMGSDEQGLHYIRKAAPSIAPMTGGDISTDVIFSRRIRGRHVVGFSVEKNIQENSGA
jgi:hypothetical protein